MLKLLPLFAILAMACHRYGPANPDSCNAKHIVDRHGDERGYDLCMLEYRRRAGLEPRPSRAAWLIPVAAAALLLRASSQPSVPGYNCYQLAPGQWQCVPYETAR